MMRMSPRGLVAGIALLVAAAACGGSNDSGSTSAGSGNNAQNSGATVSAKNVDGVGTILVDSSGMALYFADQESDGTIKCVSEKCVKVWLPLTVPDGQTPTAGSGVSGTLGTVTRPDGGTQVTLDGKPLYRFALDNTPGKVTGNGAKDSFDGTDFVWHVATSDGSPVASPTDTGGGIYNY